MIDLKFHYLRAKNMLCFGEEGIELNLDSYGPIVMIKGVNKDTGTPDSPASNGSGKSSILDALVYCVYGKTVKKPKQMNHDKIINSKAEGKGLEVEVQFSGYRILRQRGPNKLRVWYSEDHVWDDSNEVTRGTMKDTQEFIDGIVGMSHQTFCSSVIFDDNNTYAFLESDTPAKRNIIENLLGLDQYRGFHSISKDLQKEAKTSIQLLTKDYETCQLELQLCDQRIEKIKAQESAWKKEKMLEAKNLMSAVKDKQEVLKTLDASGEIEKYEQAQETILQLQNSIDENKEKKEQSQQLLITARENLTNEKNKKDAINGNIQEHNVLIKQQEIDADRCESLIEDLNNLAVGAKCPVCHGTIDKSNFGSVLEHEEGALEKCNHQIELIKLKISDELTKFKEHQVNIDKLQGIVQNLEDKIKEFEKKTSIDIAKLAQLSKISKPDMDAKQQVLESEISELKKQLKFKKEEMESTSPYQEILASAIQEKEDKEVENEEKTQKLKEAENELPYYDFWVKAFGDKGIRKFVVDGVIPALNSRIAYWMEHLYDGQITLSFDNELVETLTRNGVQAYYPALSNGEKQRVNLAVSQSFAYVMMLNSSSCPSIVFLDEITGGGIDKSGVTGIFNMICELSKNRQVFVTTHNEYLASMLDGCEEIVLEKENDITKLVT